MILMFYILLQLLVPGGVVAFARTAAWVPCGRG